MSGMELVPKDIDFIIAKWTHKNQTALSEEQFNSLVAHVFNSLLSDGQIHTVPDNDFHFESRHCFCSPNAIVEQGQKTHFIHFDHKTEKGH
ncbi:hypothetical protein [Immundisolibacter sp.]